MKTTKVIYGTLSEINKMSCLPEARVSLIKDGTTTLYHTLVVIGNLAYYTNVWLDNYHYFSDIDKELVFQLNWNKIVPSEKMKELISKLGENPAYYNWKSIGVVTPIDLGYAELC